MRDEKDYVAEALTFAEKSLPESNPWRSFLLTWDPISQVSLSEMVDGWKELPEPDYARMVQDVLKNKRLGERTIHDTVSQLLFTAIKYARGEIFDPKTREPLYSPALGDITVGVLEGVQDLEKVMYTAMNPVRSIGIA